MIFPGQSHLVVLIAEIVIHFLTCVLPEDDGPVTSVNCPWRRPPPRSVSMLQRKGHIDHYNAQCKLCCMAIEIIQTVIKKKGLEAMNMKRKGKTMFKTGLPFKSSREEMLVFSDVLE